MTLFDAAPVPLAGCTIIAKNYLAHARVLAQSFLKHHPGAVFFVLLADRLDGFFDPQKELFKLVQLDELGLQDQTLLCFQYTVVELSTAAKPFFLSHLFDRYNIQRLIFLDMRPPNNWVSTIEQQTCSWPHRYMSRSGLFISRRWRTANRS